MFLLGTTTALGAIVNYTLLITLIKSHKTLKPRENWRLNDKYFCENAQPNGRGWFMAPGTMKIILSHFTIVQEKRKRNKNFFLLIF